MTRRNAHSPSPLSLSARASVERAGRALGDRRARPNLRWLSALLGATVGSVDEYLAELATAVPLEEEIRRRHLAGGRPNYAQFRAPFELYALVRCLRPRHVVETGVSSGVSSAHFLLALQRNRHGTLHSIDLPVVQRTATFGRTDSPVALPPGRASGWAVPEPLRAGWDLRVGPSQELLPALLRSIPSVGLFLHDSLHTPTHLAFELATVRPKLDPGAIVLADNTAWTGRSFPRFARAVGVPMRARGRSDLVGLRMPIGPPGRSGRRSSARSTPPPL